MKITLKTLSALLSASGESSANIDADVKYDKHGIPFIQAKTFKGLLRESGLEVCEILGTDYSMVETLFGVTGKRQSGNLSFNNLVIKDYDSIDKELNHQSNVINPEFVKKTFTEIRQQTTIKDGTAKDKSLRKYRLINEGIEFETKIENVSDDHEDFIKNSLLNLRYMGTRRNRGFGKIKITIINENRNKAITQNEKRIEYSPGNDSLSKLSFEITTIDTLLIAKIFGEQNTVSTEKHIPAQNIRGLIAGLIIRNRNLGNNAHIDSIFHKIILTDDVKYNNAFINNAQPVPKIYGYDKTDSESNAEFIFEKQKPLKVMSGFTEILEKVLKTVNVDTTFSFHNSRFDNRLAGKSTKDDGAIFYYEGIAPQQTFKGELVGCNSDLKYIQSLLEQNEGIQRIGKSKTAQYSKVKFGKFQLNDVRNESKEDLKSPVFIVFQSPVITYNEFGIAIPDFSIIQKELASYLGNISKLSIASSADTIENYMGVWQGKTPRETAFDIGTTLKIEFDEVVKYEKWSKLEFVGLGERKAEGYGRIKVLCLAENLVRISPAEPNKNQVPVSLNPFTNVVLKEIFERQAEQEKSNSLTIKAIVNAKKYRNKLPNSLISKLKEKLMKAENLNDWTTFINDIKGKKAFKTMDESNLWESISQLKFLDAVANEINFLTNRTYWLAFFKALRVKQIKLY